MLKKTRLHKVHIYEADVSHLKNLLVFRQKLSVLYWIECSNEPGCSMFMYEAAVSFLEKLPLTISRQQLLYLVPEGLFK
jgi:hypothetical protein